MKKGQSYSYKKIREFADSNNYKEEELGSGIVG